MRTGLFLIQGIFGAYQKSDLYGVILRVLEVCFQMSYFLSFTRKYLSSSLQKQAGAVRANIVCISKNADSNLSEHASQWETPLVLRVHDLSGSVARHLSGRHSAPKGVPNETNGSATGEPKDEIRRNL